MSGKFYLKSYFYPIFFPKYHLAGMLSCFSCFQLFVTLWTAAFQAPLSMWFSMQEYWVATPSSKGSFQPGDRTQVSCDSCNAGGFFTSEPVGKPKYHLRILLLGNFILVTLLLLWSKNMITKSKFKNAFFSSMKLSLVRCLWKYRNYLIYFHK